MCSNLNEVPTVTLENKAGAAATFIPYGARWTGMRVPDRNGIPGDVVLGFEDPSHYACAEEHYHGAIVGRVCQRISGACFTLNGQTYQLAHNDGFGSPLPNHLHGGVTAFHNRMWETHPYTTPEGDQAVAFTLFSPDGEEGYPGNVEVRVDYILKRDSNELLMELSAISDRPTPLNLTNHAFFNLGGGPDILSHKLYVAASHSLECDAEYIPTGRSIPVDGTFCDFRIPRSIAESISCGGPKTAADGGLAPAFVLDRPQGDQCAFAARLHDPASGRMLEVRTTQPCMQLYTGFMMTGSDAGHGGIRYGKNCGIALEAAGYPDAVNRPEFPGTIIGPQHPYRHSCSYIFSVQ